MKGTRHSEEQIIAILKQGEAGLTTAELCRQHLRIITNHIHPRGKTQCLRELRTEYVYGPSRSIVKAVWPNR